MMNHALLMAAFMGVILTVFSPATAIAQAPVNAATVSPATIRVLLTPRHSTVLSSEIAGKIAELNVREGETFKQGQPLLAFDCAIHKARRDKAEAQLQEASAIHEVYADLARLGSMSTLDLENSAARLVAAQAESTMMRALVERCVISAPFPGRVAELMVKRYQYVAEGQELLEILDDRNLEIEMIVPSLWLSWLGAGKRFNIHIEETGRSYPAQVARIGARIDPVSQTVKIYGQLRSSSAELRTGMSGTATFDRP
jgi:membrane fusion protein, multidrug efflux system